MAESLSVDGSSVSRSLAGESLMKMILSVGTREVKIQVENDTKKSRNNQVRI